MRLQILGVLVVCATSAHAELISRSEFVSGNWSGGAYTFDEDGQFSHCAISAEYRSGNTLYFSVNNDATVKVGVANTSWSLVVGEEFPVALRVDQRTTFSGSATAVQPDMVVFSIFDMEAALAALRRGRTLSMNAPGFQQDFDLSGTFRALDQGL